MRPVLMFLLTGQWVLFFATVTSAFFMQKHARHRSAGCGEPPLHNTELRGEQDRPDRALYVGRRGYMQAALSKQKVHDTQMHRVEIDALHERCPSTVEMGLSGWRPHLFFRRQELIQLPLLNNAKVKRNGNYGVAS